MALGSATVLAITLFYAPAGFRAFAMWFRVDNPAPADAIVLLLGGIGNRPQWAAQVYREGYAPVILIGQSFTLGESPVSESSDTRRILLAEGVPASAIRILPPPAVTSTRMEAQAVRAYAKSHPLKRIIVVTSSYHTRRTRWVFRRELAGLNIDVRASAAPELLFDESNWFRSDEGLVTYLNELIKTIYYGLRY